MAGNGKGRGRTCSNDVRRLRDWQILRDDQPWRGNEVLDLFSGGVLEAIAVFRFSVAHFSLDVH